MKKLLISTFFLLLAASLSFAETIHLDDIGADYTWERFETSNGSKLDLYVFRPGGHTVSDQRSAVMCIYGGGWRGGKPEFFFPHCRYFASRGAVAFSIRYRLTTSKGIDGLTEVERCVDDCKAALRYIRKNAEMFGIDPDKIAVAGDSAGGHLAACLVTIDGLSEPAGTKVSSMANAAVCYNPCIDMNDPLSHRIFGFSDDDWNADDNGRSQNPAIMELATTLSPIDHVKRNQPPMLIMHGTADTVIDIEQAHRMKKTVTAAGNRCDLIELDGASHAFTIVGLGTEETLVRSLYEADNFLGSLGFFEGPPTIAVKDE